MDRNPGAVGRLGPDTRPETPRLRGTAAVWNAAWETARRLPEPVAFGLADLLGRIAHRLSARTRARVRANLAHAVAPAELDATVAAAFRSYARYWVEAFLAADLDPTDLDRRTTVDGMEHLDAALARGRGAVVLLAHHGTWDIAAQWAETHGYHLAVVAEVLRPRRLFAKFVRLRETVGLEVVPLGQRQELSTRLRQVLADNHLVGLLADRDLSGRGTPVTLFGAPVRLPLGPAALSQRTGAPIVPITMLQRPGRRWHLQVLPPVPVSGLTPEEQTQQVAEAIQRLILLDVTQWHAFQPVFSPGPAPAARSGGQRS